MQAEITKLRPVAAADASLLFSWINDRDLVTLSAPYRPVSEYEHQKWLGSYLEGLESAVLFVIDDLDGSAVGYCQLVDISQVHRKAEVRIRIGSVNSRNRGYGSSALRQLAVFARDDLNLLRLELTVVSGNLPAIRAYEKVGFVREGELRRAACLDSV